MTGASWIRKAPSGFLQREKKIDREMRKKELLQKCTSSFPVQEDSFALCKYNKF